jgi:AcrR family transcriptional regulator
VTPSGGGRQRLSPEARREQLVAATVEVLASAGFRATTADAIAARAGVSKGLLWYHFDDLDQLLEQTARRSLADLAHAVGDQLDLGAPVPEVIRGAVHAAAAVRRTHSAQRDAIREVVVNLRTPDGSPRLGPQDYEELHAAQEAIFRRGQAEGDVDADLDPRVLAVTYQGAVDAMLAHLDLHPDADPDAYAEQLANLLVRGFAPRP